MQSGHDVQAEVEADAESFGDPLPEPMTRTVPAAQVESMMRMLVDSGDATPMALRQMMKITRGEG